MPVMQDRSDAAGFFVGSREDTVGNSRSQPPELFVSVPETSRAVLSETKGQSFREFRKSVSGERIASNPESPLNFPPVRSFLSTRVSFESFSKNKFLRSVIRLQTLA